MCQYVQFWMIYFYFGQFNNLSIWIFISMKMYKYIRRIYRIVEVLRFCYNDFLFFIWRYLIIEMSLNRFIRSKVYFENYNSSSRDFKSGNLVIMFSIRRISKSLFRVSPRFFQWFSYFERTISEEWVLWCSYILFLNVFSVQSNHRVIIQNKLVDSEFISSIQNQ